MISFGWAAGLTAAAFMVAQPAPVRAQGLFEALFGGLSRTFQPPRAEPAYGARDRYVPARYTPNDGVRWRHAPAPHHHKGGIHDNDAARSTPTTAPPMGDPTLRPGDVVATGKGLMVYTGGRRGLPQLVPVKGYPYIDKRERSTLLALQVTPPSQRWSPEVPLAPSTTTPPKTASAVDHGEIRTAQR